MFQKNIHSSMKRKIVSFFPCLLFMFFVINTQGAHASAVNVHRFWSDTKQGHFFTASEEEKNYIIANYPSNVWKYEGTAFQVFQTPETGTVPVHRFWSDTKQGHFYTASEEEKNYIIANYPSNVWKYEGIAWHTYAGEQTGNAPVYRFWSDEKQHHFFTFNPAEKTCIQNSYAQSTWKYEGIAYWAPGIAPPNDPDATCGASLGPLISVGIWSAPRTETKSEPFKIKSASPYIIKNASGTEVAQIAANVTTKIQYDADGNMKITDSVPDTVVGSNVTFEALNGDNVSMLFSLSRSDFISSQYRGRFNFRYSPASTKIWAINILPLEQYVWGMGEITGTGPMEYNKVMTTVFRTYAFWKIKYSTKHLSEGFIVDTTPGDQIYKGYDYEMNYPRISEAAKGTRGRLLTYDGDAAITPFSSWTDGRTRSFQERWGSTSYPWCQSVADPYGKNTTSSDPNVANMTTDQLVAAGNHMVGLSAHGALNLAGSNYNWSWEQILHYYFANIGITPTY